MVMNIESNDKIDPRNFSLFALGFRPFFLFSAFFAVLLITLWVLKLSGHLTLSNYYTPTGWHAHEMLFGYTVAVIAGFLLTAAGNWTGVKMINGWKLALLSCVFLLGRVAPFIDELPHGLIAAIDLSFLPLVAIILSAPILKAKQWSNFVFILILLAMTVANTIVHLSTLKIIDTSIVTGSRAMVYLVVFLIIVMGGRVIPFFTERGVAGVTTKTWRWIEHLSALSVALLMVSDVILSNQIFTGVIAWFAAIFNLIRVAGWYSNKIWQVPLVWILQVAYVWFVIGFILKGLTLFDIHLSLYSYHALTVGGIGLMTLGMMARVSIGHTGREMQLNSWMVLSFILLNVAAIVRVILPMLMEEYYMQFLQISGWIWIISFSIYLVIYTPMWIRPRVDGRPG